MYPTALAVHSWLRWIVILLGAWALVEAATRRGQPAGRAGLLFTIALDLQLLLGVLLYAALSPITQSAMADMAGAMRNATWRFWVVEHPALMALGVVFGHVGRAVERRGGRRSVPSGSGGAGWAPFTWYGLALLAILAGVALTLGQGRPLFRM
jgi:hypothetical protein